MAYSRRSVTSFSESELLGRRRADLAHERRSAMLIVAEVRRAAAFWGRDLNIALKASGHLLKDVPSSMACSTCLSQPSANLVRDQYLQAESGQKRASPQTAMTCNSPGLDA